MICVNYGKVLANFSQALRCMDGRGEPKQPHKDIASLVEIKLLEGRI